MKTLHKILFIGFLILSTNLFGQDLRILNTKDLITISKINGLDSALKLTTGIPIYYLDLPTTRELIKQLGNSNPTDKIEYFLTDYALHFQDSILPNIIYSYFAKKVSEIEFYIPTKCCGFPELSDDVLVVMTKFPVDSTENLLIRFYNAWLLKSQEYKSDYEKGLSSTNRRSKEQLTVPFVDCNLNCSKILIALKLINSNFYNSEKIDSHEKYLPDWAQNMQQLYKSGDFTNYQDTNTYEIIELENEYSNLGEINYSKENKLKELIKGYDKSYCWKFLLYNKTIGYLDVGCQSGPLEGSGEMYRLELIDRKKIRVIIISSWIS